MTDDIHLCLTELLDQDITSYEYFHSLPKDIQMKIRKEDLRSFREMQNYVKELRR